MGQNGSVKWSGLKAELSGVECLSAVERNGVEWSRVKSGAKDSGMYPIGRDWGRLRIG